jgi:hypothetical protein
LRFSAKAKWGIEMVEATKTGRGLGLRDDLQRRMAAEAASAPREAVREAPERPVVREDDPRARAAARAAELRGHLGDIDEGTDEFYVDPNMIPDGWTYEWKRHTVYGQEDPAYQVALARAGWTPVPADRCPRHRAMMPMGSDSMIITRKGNILMECPTEIVDERRMADRRAARDQVRHKEAQIAGTPDGTLTRNDPRVAPKIKKGYSPVEIPE